VTLDGYPQMADTSNPQSDTCYQKQLFTARNLAPGHHHMTIEVIHQRDATTNGSWINVDAIDITIRSLVAGAPPAATGLVEQTNPATTYFAHWFQSADASYSGGNLN
jgi:hypothetical protein